MNPEYLTLSQAIRKYNGISLAYLTRLVRAGTIEGDRQGYQWLVKEASLRAWLAQKGKLEPEGEAEQGGEGEQGNQGEPVDRAETPAGAEV